MSILCFQSCDHLMVEFLFIVTYNLLILWSNYWGFLGSLLLFKLFDYLFTTDLV